MGRKIFFNFFVTGIMDVDVTISTSGYREYWSVSTSAYLWLGSGPQKSASTTSHGRSGNSVIFAG
jgi:hypothetical protein